MLTVTHSKDSYHHVYPVTFGVLTRRGLTESWELTVELKTVYPDIPVIIFCCAGQSEGTRSRVHEFPSTSLIQADRQQNPGRQINEIMERSSSPFTCILWSDMRITGDLFNQISLEHQQNLCTVPLLQEPEAGVLPRSMVPYLEDRHVKFAPSQESGNTLFPFDYAGLYDTPAFRAIGGFAESFYNPYWQLADFGTRTFLWGYRLRQTDCFSMTYCRSSPVYDATRDQDYIRWYRRNCSVKRTGRGLKRHAVRLHQQAAEEKRWLNDHLHRFMRSIEEVAASWHEL